MICSIIRFQLNLKVKQKESVKKWEKDIRLLWTNITVHISEGFSIKPIPPYRTKLQLQCRFPHQHFLWIKVRALTLMFQNIKFILFFFNYSLVKLLLFFSSLQLDQLSFIQFKGRFLFTFWILLVYRIICSINDYKASCPTCSKNRPKPTWGCWCWNVLVSFLQT